MTGKKNDRSDTGNQNATPPPNSPFVLLTTLFWHWPSWLRTPVSVLVLVFFAYWAIVPDAQKAEFFSHLTSKPIGTSLFPSVEYEKADYLIELDGAGNATWTLNFIFKRLRKEATMLADTIATSGDKRPEFRSATHTTTIVRDHYDPPGQAKMNRYVATLDISNAPLDTPIPAQLRYVTLENFRGEKQESAGVLILQATRKATVQIKFPTTKQPHNFQFSTNQWSAPNNVENLQDLAYGYNEVNRTLTWSIDYPKLNRAYSVRWDW